MNGTGMNGTSGGAQEKYTSMDFLNQLTRGNPKMILEMIKVYLEETPRLMNNMKQAIERAEWDSVARTAHAMVPSFATMGMNKEYGIITKSIQEHAEKKADPQVIRDLFGKIEDACEHAYTELEEQKNVLENKSI